MSRATAVQMVGDAWRRLNLSQDETQHCVRQLRANDLPVQVFGHDGYSCEVDGTQVFRATRLGDTFPPRYHVKLNSTLFPDV